MLVKVEARIMKLTLNCVEENKMILKIFVRNFFTDVYPDDIADERLFIMGNLTLALK